MICPCSLCCVMLCYVVLCCVALCCVVLCCDASCCVVCCGVVLCCVMSCRVLLCCVTLLNCCIWYASAWTHAVFLSRKHLPLRDAPKHLVEDYCAHVVAAPTINGRKGSMTTYVQQNANELWIGSNMYIILVFLFCYCDIPWSCSACE